MDLTYQPKLCSLDLSGFVSVHKVLGKVMGLLVRRFVSLMRRRFGRELRFICVFFLSKFFSLPRRATPPRRSAPIKHLFERRVRREMAHTP